eukprot:346748_1
MSYEKCNNVERSGSNNCHDNITEHRQHLHNDRQLNEDCKDNKPETVEEREKHNEIDESEYENDLHKQTDKDSEIKRDNMNNESDNENEENEEKDNEENENEENINIMKIFKKFKCSRIILSYLRLSHIVSLSFLSKSLNKTVNKYYGDCLVLDLSEYYGVIGSPEFDHQSFMNVFLPRFKSI